MNKEERREYNKKYSQKPEVKARKRKYQKKYSQRPEVKKRMSEYHKIYQKPYRQKPEVKKRRREWDRKNSQRPEVKTRIKKYNKAYNQNNKEKFKQYEKKPEVKLKRKTYRQKPETKRRLKKYLKKPENKKRIKEWKKQYLKKPEVKKRRNEYYKVRGKIDKEFLVICRLRGLLYSAFRHYTKTGKMRSASKYGIDYQIIINHLKPFPENISNYDIDHIKPLCSFTFIKEDGSTDLEEIKKAFAPENHQWLTAHENRSKGGRY